MYPFRGEDCRARAFGTSDGYRRSRTTTLARRRANRGFFGRIADNLARWWAYKTEPKPKTKAQLREEMRKAFLKAGLTDFL